MKIRKYKYTQDSVISISCSEGCGWESHRFKVRNIISVKVMWWTLVFLEALHYMGARHIAWTYAQSKP